MSSLPVQSFDVNRDKGSPVPPSGGAFGALQEDLQVPQRGGVLGAPVATRVLILPHPLLAMHLGAVRCRGKGECGWDLGQA